MTIDWTSCNPWTALPGGFAIGLGAALLLLLNGRIAGVSGIVGGLLQPTRHDLGWRIAFVAGLVAAPLAHALVAPLPAAQVEAGPGLMLAAGLAVGVGTRWGSGCTSGHGVCGVSRRSPRSIVATLVFVAAGCATVHLLRHAAAA